MNTIKRNLEDHPLLALLYEDYCRMYPQNIDFMQCEIETVYYCLHQRHLPNAEEIAAAILDICNRQSRCAYEEGLRTGVQLTLELELDRILTGDRVYAPDF